MTVAWYNFLRKDPDKIPEQVRSESVYSSYFEKYNPDTLIGKKGHAIYRKMLLDEQVKAAIKFKRDAITSREFYIETEDPEIEDIVNASIDTMAGTFTDGLNGIMSAQYQGFSVTEKIIKLFDYEGRQYYGIDKLKVKPFDTFTFEIDEFGNVQKITQKIGAKTHTIDPESIIHFVINPEFDEHYGQSDLREAYRAWFSKDVIIKLRNIHLERVAGGFRWFTPKEGKALTPGTAEYNNLKNIITNIQTSTGIIIPSGIELNADYPPNNTMFKEAISDCNTDISRALLVPPLLGVSPQGETGSYAQADIQLEAFMWTLEADGKRLEDTLNEQLFRELFELNFGNVPIKFRFKPISTRERDKLITTWKELVSSGAVTKSESDEKHIRSLLNFPELEEPEKEPEDDLKEAPMDETILGKVLSSFDRATQRVDFAVIAKKSDEILEYQSSNITEVTDEIARDLVSKAQEKEPVKPDSKLKRKLHSQIAGLIKDGFKLGERHAANEIDKAKGKTFTATRGRMDMIAEDYFKIKSFKVTGTLTDDIVKIIEFEILNGAKYDKTWQETEKAIYTALAKKGMISEELAKEYLAEAVGHDARIKTMIRTNTFEAINEARYSYFTDPALGGFVKAFEYSAILDSRVTTICRHLGEEGAGNHSSEWYSNNLQYKPPNHHNCRSLLVPVTQSDEFTEGPEPTIEPQEGFK